MTRYRLRRQIKRGDPAVKRVMLAFLTAAMFLLAGAIEIAMDLGARGSIRLTDFRTGGIFVFAGMMWVAVGAKWRKAAQQK